MVLAAYFTEVILAGSQVPSVLRPVFTIIMVTFIALIEGGRGGLLAGAFAGLLFDISSLRLFGMNIVLFSAVGYLIGRYSTKFYRESRITHAILIFSSSYTVLTDHFIASHTRADAAFYPGLLLNGDILLSSVISSFFGVLFFVFLMNVLGISEEIA